MPAAANGVDFEILHSPTVFSFGARHLSGERRCRLCSARRGGDARAPLASRSSFSLLGSLWLFFEHSKLNLLFDRIDAIDQHADLLSQAVDLAVALADDLARVLVKSIA